MILTPGGQVCEANNVQGPKVKVHETPPYKLRSELVSSVGRAFGRILADDAIDQYCFLPVAPISINNSSNTGRLQIRVSTVP